jgi:hypothetical protein
MFLRHNHNHNHHHYHHYPCDSQQVRFGVVKRGDEEMVGVAVPLGASGGTGSMGGLGSDHAIEDVLRTRWQVRG